MFQAMKRSFKTHKETHNLIKQREDRKKSKTYLLHATDQNFEKLCVCDYYSNDDHIIYRQNL